MVLLHVSYMVLSDVWVSYGNTEQRVNVIIAMLYLVYQLQCHAFVIPLSRDNIKV